MSAPTLADGLHACRAFCVIQDPRPDAVDNSEVAEAATGRLDVTRMHAIPSPGDSPPPHLDGWAWMGTHIDVDTQAAEACLIHLEDGCISWLDAGLVDRRGELVRGKKDRAWVDEMRKAAKSANTDVLQKMSQRVANLIEQRRRKSRFSCFVEAASSGYGTSPDDATLRKTLPDFHGLGGA